MVLQGPLAAVREEGTTVEGIWAGCKLEEQSQRKDCDKVESLPS